MRSDQQQGPTAPGTQAVMAFLDQLEHPLKPAIRQVRTCILSADQELTEHIKWQAPSFCHRGEDRVTFNLKGTDSFRLIFHRGAKVKATQGPSIDDPTGLLTWVADDRATVTFGDLEDVKRKETALIRVVNQWLAATS